MCGLALLAAARGVLRHNTWYLASDQFAFLTIADDLARGRVFHDPATIARLVGPMMPTDAAADAYYQTYIFRDGRLYSRYPPGYPLLLAAAHMVGGEAAQHALNPILYVVLIGLLGLVAARCAVRGAELATAAAAMWAMLVLPVEVHYWGITIARDLPAHFLALVALLVARAGYLSWAALLLGVAATVRPDAALWAPAIGLAAPDTSRTTRVVLQSALAFAAGALPLFLYNTVTQGHPFAFTQGSEFRGFLQTSANPSSMTLAGVSFVSGGGFRLAHFPDSFRANLQYLRGSFGVLLLLGLGVAVAGGVRGWRTARGLGMYFVIALLFYSCWGHGDARYLVGGSLGLIVLSATALGMLAQLLGDQARPARLRGGVLLLVLGLCAGGSLLPGDAAPSLPMIERALGVGLVVAAGCGLLRATHGWGVVLPALALATLGGQRILASTGAGAGFGAVEIDRARQAIHAVVPPGAVVLTTSGLGRPAENWTHYAGIQANYLGELPRLFSDADLVAWRCTEEKRPFFLLLGAADPLPFASPSTWITQRVVAKREGAALRDWFIDPERAPTGAVLYEVRLGLPAH